MAVKEMRQGVVASKFPSAAKDYRERSLDPLSIIRDLELHLEEFMIRDNFMIDSGFTEDDVIFYQPYHPQDGDLVIAQGPGYTRMFRYVEQSSRPVLREEYPRGMDIPLSAEIRILGVARAGVHFFEAGHFSRPRSAWQFLSSLSPYLYPLRVSGEGMHLSHIHHDDILYYRFLHPGEIPSNGSVVVAGYKQFLFLRRIIWSGGRPILIDDQEDTEELPVKKGVSIEGMAKLVVRVL